MRRLIVNADDFGLAPGVNRAVIELHRAGALTSATLMAVAPSFAEAVVLAKENPRLGVGCHIVLVDGAPLSPPEGIASLLDPGSAVPAFRPTLGHFVRDLMLGRIHPQHILVEATAQVQRLQASGLALTHVDTHKHTHIFPRVLAPVLRAAQACGVRRIRNPFEPEWSIAATPQAGRLRRMEVRVLRTMRRRFLSHVNAAGMATTDGCLGVLATGMLDAASIGPILAHMPPGTWELLCHPAYVDAELRAAHTRLVGSRATELQALLATLACATEKDTAAGGVDMQRIHFGDLPV
ncbi:MAG: ChbG/HpnK family deacetylase [Acidobacteriaceae bacterium]